MVLPQFGCRMKHGLFAAIALAVMRGSNKQTVFGRGPRAAAWALGGMDMPRVVTPSCEEPLSATGSVRGMDIASVRVGCAVPTNLDRGVFVGVLCGD